jgi:hypothetical protein
MCVDAWRAELVKKQHEEELVERRRMKEMFAKMDEDLMRQKANASKLAKKTFSSFMISDANTCARACLEQWSVILREKHRAAQLAEQRRIGEFLHTLDSQITQQKVRSKLVAKQSLLAFSQAFESGSLQVCLHAWADDLSRKKNEFTESERRRIRGTLDNLDNRLLSHDHRSRDIDARLTCHRSRQYAVAKRTYAHLATQDVHVCGRMCMGAWSVVVKQIVLENKDRGERRLTESLRVLDRLFHKGENLMGRVDVIEGDLGKIRKHFPIEFHMWTLDGRLESVEPLRALDNPILDHPLRALSKPFDGTRTEPMRSRYGTS